MEPATTEPAIAIIPMRPSGEKLEPAVPPWPVAGAPTGMIVAPVPVAAEDFVLAPAFTVTTGFVAFTGCFIGGFFGAFVPVPATVVVVVVIVVVVVGAVAARHVGTVMVLSSRVTAPVWASARPARLASVFRVIDVRARMVPTKLVDVPSVAE